MNDATRDRLVIAGFIIAVFTLLMSLFRKNDALQNALRAIGDGSFLQPLGNIVVPKLDSDGISINIPSFAGDPFAGTPVGDTSGLNSCGCSPYQCPENRVEYVQLPMPMIAPTVNIAPPLFDYQATAAIPKVCAWNATGYASANPDVANNYPLFLAGVGKEKKYRKRWGPLTKDQYLRKHYEEWGASEGRTWDCP